MQRMPALSDTDMLLFELKTRFTRNYLAFAGKSSKDFLLYLSTPGVYDSPEADVELEFVPGRSGDLIRDNAKAGERRFKNLDVSYDDFFFDAVAPRTAAVKSWLLSPVGYQVLHGMGGSGAGLDGMGLAGHIRGIEAQKQPIVIFVTGYEKYVYDAFRGIV